jgi:DNA-binding PadR family transcriptional regulator
MDQQGVFCKVKHHKTEKFLEVAILLVLYEGENYGYGITEALARMGYETETFNTSTLYRSLRRMEREGFVSSCWQESDHGPRKRVYRVNDAGIIELENWIRVLDRRRKMIDGVVDRFKAIQKTQKAGE